MPLQKDGKDLGDFSLVNLISTAYAEGEGYGGNEATCYSTYQTPLLFGTTIWVCGSCVQQKAKNFSDSGTCYF